MGPKAEVGGLPVPAGTADGRGPGLRIMVVSSGATSLSLMGSVAAVPPADPPRSPSSRSGSRTGFDDARLAGIRRAVPHRRRGEIIPNVGGARIRPG